MAQVLDETEIESRLRGSSWERSGGEITREWRLRDFTDAIAFVNRVAEVAEKRNHHPDILVHGYNRVRLTLSTHSAGGLTENDFELARRVDALE